MNHPLLLLGMTAAGIYVFKLWWDDVRAAEAGIKQSGALPGARRAPPGAIAIGVMGALLILGTETGGEIVFGLADQQSRMTWLFALYSITGAPVIEELIFRGWLVVENRGRLPLWTAAIGASLAFAAMHPFLWEWDGGGFQLTLDAKSAFSTAILFASSLWFYAVRLGPWNPSRSLLPCIIAHAAKNAGVVAVKAATGFMGAVW